MCAKQLDSKQLISELRDTATRILNAANASNLSETDPSSVMIYAGGDGKRPAPIIKYNVDLDRGNQLSYRASAQQQEVAMTPYMKNALYRFGDLKEGERLMVDSPITKAEAYIQEKTKHELMKQFGEERTEYDRKLSCTDVKHYAVDCWRNFKTGITMRDIQPGQQAQREEGFSDFRSHAPVTANLFNDQNISIALRSVLDDMPHNIKRSEEFVDWAGPFSNKHTQTSWPFFYRDDVIVSSDNDPQGQLRHYYGKTYGEMCIDIAKNTPLSETKRWIVNMGYGRNQRGKGRPLIAMARVPAVVFNRMTMPETEACKTRCPFFVGYNDRTFLKNALIKQADKAIENGWDMENFDYHAFDRSISPQWLALGGAVWCHLAADKVSRDIAFVRAAYPIKGYLIDGIAEQPDQQIAPIYGRMTSGFIETNKTENVINAVASTAALLACDQQWINQVHRRSPYARMYMGDDCLITYRPDHFDHDDYVKHIANYGFEVHPDKGEFGAFFLQNRLMDSDEGMKMAYPWTRVLRSCLFKEQSRGLGPCGWTLATYSQLANIAEYKPGLAFVRDLIIEFDDEKLMLDKPIKEIIRGVQEEDANALSTNKRAASTYEIINDGDPGKHQLSAGESSYLEQLQRTIREA